MLIGCDRAVAIVERTLYQKVAEVGGLWVLERPPVEGGGRDIDHSVPAGRPTECGEISPLNALAR